ncbi:MULTISPECIES: hypothetical protein [unclassified Sedimentibacter]|uniref:hypothetical protein n=1 Tax=unclassified Sedimentibacter TaxID=2649220 RepID=UPI001BD6A667|nr:hypothetical protein [Sedimentibacter sp. MB35-C1]WMJ78255.1 hypothetical protein RBQ61_04810 [Sedimentibacter sp. MB35-C1]
MKLLNQPIKMMAIFNSDGSIQPIKFRFDDIVVNIEKVLKIYEEKIVGNRRIVFVCQHKGKDIYELKYEIDSRVWYLFKK